MTAQQLKNSILQMAVQGKLVPQDPNDEPASILLQRIKAEKQELIKTGKIKKDKKSSEIFRGATHNLPYAYCEQIGKEIRDISDEIPFEIPESWEWCRLSDLAIKEIKRGKSPVYADSGSVLVFAQKCNVKTGRINITLAKYLSDSVISKYPQEEYMQDRDIIVNSTGTGTLGRIGLYSDRDNPNNLPLVPDSHVTIVRVCKSISQYIYYILKWYQPYLEESGEGSTKQKELKADRIKELFIPIPPLAEQHRIVAKIEELLPYIERYGKAEEHLTTLNTTFPEALKKSILQEAVQGKLVPQNPDDEPASVLLERIRAEKQELIKQGKIKQNKNESVIITRDKIPYEIIDGKERCLADEVPFEIPDSWCWCRLSNVSIIQEGAGIRTYQYRTSGTQILTVTNILEGSVDMKKATKYIATEEYLDKYQHLTLNIGDIVSSCSGASWGKTAIWDYGDTVMLNTSTLRLRFFNDTAYNMYLYWLTKTPLFKNQLIAQLSGMQPNFGYSHYSKVLIPLPPLAEQHRIVAKIEEIMPMIERLTQR
ncbi:Type I restriction enzyme EcoKI specificity protein [uncultured Ruminococcus sp.]|nr:Type I restriction enzyme EcoKI specificity protein [uncultured Ruminococcus sp.]